MNTTINNYYYVRNTKTKEVIMPMEAEPQAVDLAAKINREMTERAAEVIVVTITTTTKVI